MPQTLDREITELHLQDKTVYRRATEKEFTAQCRKLNDMCVQIGKSAGLDERFVSPLKLDNPNCPVFYSPFKTHKVSSHDTQSMSANTYKIRPITSCVGGPTDRISWFLTKIDMSANFIELHGVKVFTNIGLWPYSDEGVRIWNGTIRLDATSADTNHMYKVRCSCHKEHLRYIRCTHGTGKVRMGEFKHLSLKVPEPAINTAIMTILIDDMDVDLNLYMLEGARELYFGDGEIETDTETLTETKGKSRELKWSRRSNDERAFEMVSDLIKPVFKDAPKGLSDYLMNSSSTVSTWQRLNDMVYPIVLELLEDLGDFARREANRRESSSRTIFNKMSTMDVGDELAEIVLVRLSEKLRSDFARPN